MGFQTQPCCCGSDWIVVTYDQNAISNPQHRIYDLDVGTAALSNMRSMGTLPTPICGGLETVGGTSYFFTHGLFTGLPPKFYRVDIASGATTLIGTVRDNSDSGDPTKDGAFGGSICLSAAGDKLLGFCAGGTGRRWCRVMEFDTSTGAGTVLTPTTDYLGNAFAALAIVPIPWGARRHTSGALVVVTNEITTYLRVRLLDAGTWLLGSPAETDWPLASGAVLGLDYDDDDVAFMAGTALFRCDDILAGSPQVMKVADWSGLVDPTNELVRAIHRVRG